MTGYAIKFNENVTMSFIVKIMIDLVIKANKKYYPQNIFRRMSVYARRDNNWELN